MTKIEITNILDQKLQNLLQWLDASGDENWDKGPKDRWTTGQHIQHLVDSARMLNKALRYPKFLVKYKFGTSNRPSRSYEEVAKRYQERLQANQEKAKNFNKDLRRPELSERPSLIQALTSENEKLKKKTLKLRDKHLDTLLLPHPLLGRMTFREIIMWTAYHTHHHCEILNKDYSL